MVNTQLLIRVLDLVIFILIAVGIVWYYFRKRERQWLKKQETNEKLIKYLQIQTLQAQINPHFIFNILGAMQNQILNSDPQTANRHLVSLSKLMRAFLDSTISSGTPGQAFFYHEITLEKEIELLNLYIAFEQQQRLGKFGYEILIDPTLNLPNINIPPLIIQPYVENAIKHGLLYKEDDEIGKLTITFNNCNNVLVCIIEDNGVGREKANSIQQKSRKLYQSQGTRLVQDRVAVLNELGYHIHIETNDKPGGGTIVTIKIE